MEVEWIAASRLQIGDEVVLHDHRSLGGWDGAGNESEGYLLGLLIGDGTLKQDMAVLSVWAPELKLVGDGEPVTWDATGAAGIVAAAETAAGSLDHRGVTSAVSTALPAAVKRDSSRLHWAGWPDPLDWLREPRRSRLKSSGAVRHSFRAYCAACSMPTARHPAAASQRCQRSPQPK